MHGHSVMVRVVSCERQYQWEMTKLGASYRGDSIFLAVLSEGRRPRAVCRQLRYDHSRGIGGHSPSGKETRGASGERK